MEPRHGRNCITLPARQEVQVTPQVVCRQAHRLPCTATMQNQSCCIITHMTTSSSSRLPIACSLSCINGREACLQNVHHVGWGEGALAAHHLAQLVQGGIVGACPGGPAGQALSQPLRALAAVLRPLHPLRLQLPAQCLGDIHSKHGRVVQSTRPLWGSTFAQGPAHRRA